MSEGLQNQSQKILNLSSDSHISHLNDDQSKKKDYYPFLMRPPSSYPDFMYTYADPTTLLYPRAPILSVFDYFYSQKRSQLSTSARQEEQKSKPDLIKTQNIQEASYLIKVQAMEEEHLQKQQKLEPLSAQQKKKYKQLYLQNQRKLISRSIENDPLKQKFKAVLEMHIEQVKDEEAFSKIYNTLFAQQISQDHLFFEQLMQKLFHRMKSIKKTKEELIKFIIRRTYHLLRIKKNLTNIKPEYERLEQFHQKNLAIFKSMNIHFLKRQFSNQLFVQLFKDFMCNLDQQFEKENFEKVQRLSMVLVKCWRERTAKFIALERKLPWINTQKEKIKKISNDLLLEHDGCLSKDHEMSRG